MMTLFFWAQARRGMPALAAAAQAVSIPVIGIGGIGSAEDALEFIIAGAQAVQIGTMNFVRPSVWAETFQGLKEYCQRHGIRTLSELSGTLVVGD